MLKDKYLFSNYLHAADPGRKSFVHRGLPRSGGCERNQLRGYKNSLNLDAVLYALTPICPSSRLKLPMIGSLFCPGMLHVRTSDDNLLRTATKDYGQGSRTLSSRQQFMSRVVGLYQCWPTPSKDPFDVKTIKLNLAAFNKLQTMAR